MVCVCVCVCVCVLVAQPCPSFVAPWTVARQAPLSMEFSRQKYWNGLPCPSPGDLPDPGIKPRFPALQADSLPSEPPHGKCQHLLLEEQIAKMFLWVEWESPGTTRIRDKPMVQKRQKADNKMRKGSAGSR